MKDESDNDVCVRESAQNPAARPELPVGSTSLLPVEYTFSQPAISLQLTL